MYDPLVAFFVGVLVGMILGVVTMSVLLVIKQTEERREQNG